MFLFYGYRTEKVRSKRPKDIVCHNCGKKDYTAVNTYASSCHIWFIPLFAYRIVSEIECIHCHYSIDFNSMDNVLYNSYQKYKPKLVFPVLHFSGVLITFIIILFVWINNLSNRSTMESNLNIVKPGFIFDFETEDESYSNFKVTEIEDTNYSIVYNKFTVPSENMIERIEGKNNFSLDTLILSKNEIIKMINEGRVSSFYPSQ